ncbi:MAG: NAD(P)H-dependent oxidoreductase [Rhodospirillales bacterium]|nr:MAG: NAD(P)H-dependent oxidoreductase [Rhodospirillales bacterium]
MSATRLLRLDCSPKGPEAWSWRAADALEARLRAGGGGLAVTRRDLGRAPPGFVDQAFTKAMPAHRTAESARGVAALAESEALIAELEATDALLISTPMHNYTVPACLKAWIDQVVRAGRSFTIEPGGKVGTLRDRPSYVVVASGGYYTGERARQPDFLTSYLREILATIGLRDTRFVRLEGVTRGEDAAAEAWAGALREIEAALA